MSASIRALAACHREGFEIPGLDAQPFVLGAGRTPAGGSGKTMVAYLDGKVRGALNAASHTRYILRPAAVEVLEGGEWPLDSAASPAEEREVKGFLRRNAAWIASSRAHLGAVAKGQDVSSMAGLGAIAGAMDAPSTGSLGHILGDMGGASMAQTPMFSLSPAPGRQAGIAGAGLRRASLGPRPEIPAAGSNLTLMTKARHDGLMPQGASAEQMEKMAAMLAAAKAARPTITPRAASLIESRSAQLVAPTIRPGVSDPFETPGFADTFPVLGEDEEGNTRSWVSSISGTKAEIEAFFEAAERHGRHKVDPGGKPPTVARAAILSLPSNTTPEMRLRMMDALVAKIVPKGCQYAAAVHAPTPDNHEANYHVHLMWSMMPAQRDAEGRWDFAVVERSKTNVSREVRPYRQSQPLDGAFGCRDGGQDRKAMKKMRQDIADAINGEMGEAVYDPRGNREAGKGEPTMRLRQQDVRLAKFGILTDAALANDRIAMRRQLQEAKSAERKKVPDADVKAARALLAEGEEHLDLEGYASVKAKVDLLDNLRDQAEALAEVREKGVIARAQLKSRLSIPSLSDMLSNLASKTGRKGKIAAALEGGVYAVQKKIADDAKKDVEAFSKRSAEEGARITGQIARLRAKEKKAAEELALLLPKAKAELSARLASGKVLTDEEWEAAGARLSEAALESKERKPSEAEAARRAESLEIRSAQDEIFSILSAEPGTAQADREDVGFLAAAAERGRMWRKPEPEAASEPTAPEVPKKETLGKAKGVDPFKDDLRGGVVVDFAAALERDRQRRLREAEARTAREAQDAQLLSGMTGAAKASAKTTMDTSRLIDAAGAALARATSHGAKVGSNERPPYQAAPSTADLARQKLREQKERDALEAAERARRAAAKGMASDLAPKAADKAAAKAPVKSAAEIAREKAAKDREANAKWDRKKDRAKAKDEEDQK